MGFRKVADPEELTNQNVEEAVPLTKSVQNNSEKQHESLGDEVPSHLEPYLQTKPSFGLTSQQVNERMEQFGRNELEEKKRNKILHFLSFCKHFKKIYTVF